MHNLSAINTRVVKNAQDFLSSICSIQCKAQKRQKKEMRSLFLHVPTQETSARE